MVDAARCRVHATTRDTADDFFIINRNFDHVVDDHAGFLQGFSLRNGPREAIKEETIGAIGLGDALLDQIDDQVIGDQTTAVHHAFGNQAQFSASLDRSTQHVTGGDLRNTKLLGDETSLGTFTGTGRPQQNHAHRCAPQDLSKNRRTRLVGPISELFKQRCQTGPECRKAAQDTQRTHSAQATESRIHLRPPLKGSAFASALHMHQRKPPPPSAIRLAGVTQPRRNTSNTDQQGLFQRAVGLIVAQP